MSRPVPGILLIISTLIFISSVQAQVARSRMAMLMGSRFDFTIVAADSATAERYIDTCIAEVRRIEYLLSDWKEETPVSNVNRNAGIKPVKVDPEVIAITERALEYSRLTNGAFDISFAAMEKIWRFDGSMTTMPAPEAVKKAVEKVGYQNIIIDHKDSTIFLKLKGMKIGFGALGEGYAADRCKAMMLARGIKAGIVNGSGDMNTWGRQPGGKRWNIGIRDPFDNESLFAILPLRTTAVTTSGSYEKFLTIEGKRYSHIINPATGYPATGLSSVSIFGPSAEKANFLSTSIMVLGREKGVALLKRFKHYRYIIVSDEGKFTASKNLRLDRYRTKDQ